MRLIVLSGLLLWLAFFVLAQDSSSTTAVSAGSESVSHTDDSSTMGPNPSSTTPTLLPTASSSASALPSSIRVEKTSFGNQLVVQAPLDPALAVAGAVLIVVALGVAGLGATTIWTSAGAAGFLLSALFALALICILRLQASDINPSQKTIFMLVAGGLVAGSIGATAATSSRHLCALIGATGGIAFGSWILSLGDDGLIHSAAGRLGFLVGLGVIGTMSATDHRYRNVVRIAGSSTTGAFVLMLGIDCCWRSGLREMLLYQIGFHDLFPGLDGSLPTSPRTQLFEAIGCAVVLLSAGFQRRILYRQPGSTHQLAFVQDEDLVRDIDDLTAAFKADPALKEWEAEYGEKRRTDTSKVASIALPARYSVDNAAGEADEVGLTPPPPFEADEPTLESRFGEASASVLFMLGEGAEETAAATGDFYVQPLRRSYAIDPEIARAEALRAEVAALRAQLEEVDPPPPPEPAPDFLGVRDLGVETEGEDTRRFSSWSLPSRYLAPTASAPKPDVFTSAPWLSDDYHAAPKSQSVPQRPPLAVLPPAPISAIGSTVFIGANAQASSELSAWSRPPRPPTGFVPGSQSAISAYSRTASSVHFAPGSPPPTTSATPTRRSLAPDELAARHRRKLAELQGAALVPKAPPPPTPRATSTSTSTSQTTSTARTSTGTSGSEQARRRPRRVGEARGSGLGEQGRRRRNKEEARQTRHSHWLDYA